MSIRAILTRSRILLLGILIAATFFRLGWPGISEFKYDEAMISRRAIGLVHEGIWPASTISSIPGIPQPPLKALLLAIPFAATRNPAAAVAFQGALGVLSVGMTYWLGKRYFGERVGLIAAALLAFAPWAIFYDREIWSMNVPIFTLLMMLGLYAFIVERKSKAVVLALVALGLLIGFYLGNLILAGVVVLSLAFYSRSLFTSQPSEARWQRMLWLGVGVIGLLVTLLPYAIEFVSGRADLSQALHSTNEAGERAFLPLEQMRFAAHVGTGYQFHALAGDKFRDYYQTLPLPDLGALDYGAMWLIIVAMIYVVLKGASLTLHRDKTSESWPDAPPASPIVLLALWILVPIAAWSVSGLKPWPHRYVMMYPAQHLALAILLSDGVDWIGRRWHRARSVAVALVVVWMASLAVWQSVEYLGMLQFVSTEQIIGGHGRPTRLLWNAAQQARRLAAVGNLPIVVHTDGADPEHEGGPAEIDAVLGDFHLYLLGDNRLEVMPLGSYIWIGDSRDGSYDVESRTSPDISDAPVLARLANGVDLVSIEAGQPDSGQSLPVTLTWRVWNVIPGGLDHGYTVQLYTDDGQRWGQVDGQFVRSLYWRAGDQITVSIDLSVDANMPTDGVYHLLIAMYAYLPDSQQGVDVLDIAGNPSGQSVTVPLP